MPNRIIRIAIADDHKVFLTGFAAILNNSTGIKVIAKAHDGQNLIDQLSSIEILPDICLLDIEMKTMNGYDATKLIALKWPGIKIVAITAFESEYSIIRMLRNGARAYLTKYEDLSTIIHAIKTVYTTGYFFNNISQDIIAKALHGNVATQNNINDKELEFLAFCCSDMSYKEISEKMFVSERTIEGYRNNLFKKLNVKNRSGLVMFAILSGISPYKAYNSTNLEINQ